MPSQNRLCQRVTAVLALLVVGCGHPQRAVKGPGPTSRPAASRPAPPAAAAATARGLARGVLPREALGADLDQLVALLEASHPDPYARGGGRVAFHERAARIRAAIPAGGMTARAFLRLVAPLVAAVGDGHTTIGLPRRRDARGRRQAHSRAWVDLGLTADAVYVARAFGQDGRRHVGREVVAIEGVPIARLAQRMRRLRGADNRYQNLVHLVQVTERPEWLAPLLEVAKRPTALRLTLRDPATAKLAELHVPIGAKSPGPAVALPTRLALPKTAASDIGWGFVGEGRDRVALLRIRSMMRYREAFEIWRATRFVGNRGPHLDAVAAAAVGATAAAKLGGVDAKIAAIPSAVEALAALVAAMERRGVRKLIVDLRDNGGGNSLIVAILQAVLFGPATLDEPRPGYQVPRLSKLYFDNYRTDPAKELARRGLRALGDYDFADRRAAPSRGRDRSWRAQVRKLSPTFARYLDRAKGARPPALELAVVTSARTYSAGFDAAMTLFRRGARVVGVASAQAGNCFIDTLGYRLARSGLTGGISYKRSVRFPHDPKLGEVLAPDVELSYRELVAGGFDRHASIRLAMRALTARGPERLARGALPLRFKGPTDGALALLRHRYRLAEVAGRGGDELARLIRLRDWVHRRWQHHSTNLPHRSDALSILAEAEQGRRFRCVEYSIVLAQAYRAMGYCARLVRLQGKGAHVLTEVYSRKLRKWLMMDAQFPAHVIRGGVPLSARELQQALVGAKGQGGKPPIQGLVDGRAEPRYIEWLAPYLRLLMVPVDMSYERELETLAVLLPRGAARPRRKPAYLRKTRYLYTHDQRAIYPTCRAR